MKSWVQGCVLILGGLALGGQTVRANDLDAVQRQILERWQKHRSMTAKVTQTEGTEAQGNTAARHGEGTYEFMRKAGKFLFRMEIESAWEVKAGGQDLRVRISTLTVCDGDHVYELSERMGLATALKRKPDPRDGADLKAFLEILRTRNDLKLLDEESVNGRDVFAIQATPKSKLPSRPYQTVVYYFSKDHGVLLKQEKRDKDGKPLETMSFSDLKFDVKIDPKRFEFKAPEGVVVQDLTRE